MSGIISNKRKLVRLLYITLAISLLVVWGQSCLSKAESTVNSDMVVGVLMPVEEMKNGTQEQFEEYDRAAALVRKIAHVVEYSALGFQIMAIFLLKDKKRINDHVSVLYIGLTIALIDETLQIFSSRGPLVSDLWIDLAGIVVGIGLVSLVRLIVTRRKTQKVDEMQA